MGRTWGGQGGGRLRRPSGDERYASRRPHHVNYMYFTISKTPRIIIWVQNGPEFCARVTRETSQRTSTRTPTGCSQSVHTRVATRTQHASTHGPSAKAHGAAPGSPRMTLRLQIAPRWRPEACSGAPRGDAGDLPLRPPSTPTVVLEGGRSGDAALQNAPCGDGAHVSQRLRGVVGAARAERARSPSPCSPRSQSATPRMKIDQPARARSSHDLRKRTRSSQLAESITKICGSFAMDRGKSSALTIQHCRRSSNGRCGVGNTHLSFHLGRNSSSTIDTGLSFR